jgi:hypothetical protein
LGTAQAQQIFSGSGLNAATAFGDFKTAIGGVNNGGGGGPQTGGFRTIDWDAVKLDGTDFGGNTTVIDLNHTIGIPTNRFQARGVVFEEVYAVSGDQFATVNPATAGQFNNFSPSNTFVMFDQTNGQFEDRFIDQHFTLAGTTTLAGTRGFGAIFNDVELPGSSSIEYFGRDASNNKVSLGKFNVATGASGESEFLGVLFDQPIVTDVTLTVGTNALFSFDGTTLASFGAQNLANGIDLAITDDFVFAEPTPFTAVPEPSTAVLFASGTALLAAQRLRRLRRK